MATDIDNEYISYKKSKQKTSRERGTMSLIFYTLNNHILFNLLWIGLVLFSSVSAGSGICVDLLSFPHRKETSFKVDK